MTGPAFAFFRTLCCWTEIYQWKSKLHGWNCAACRGRWQELNP